MGKLGNPFIDFGLARLYALHNLIDIIDFRIVLGNFQQTKNRIFAAIAPHLPFENELHGGGARRCSVHRTASLYPSYYADLPRRESNLPMACSKRLGM